MFLAVYSGYVSVVNIAFFYDFCSFRSVAVNSVYKLQLFYIYNNNHKHLCIAKIKKSDVYVTYTGN